MLFLAVLAAGRLGAQSTGSQSGAQSIDTQSAGLQTSSTQTNDSRPTIGTFFSFNRSGFSFTMQPSAENAFWEVTVGIDYGGSVLNQNPAPGIAGTFSYNLIIADWSHSNGSSRLYAGPGAMLGYIRDKDKPYGVVAALTGTFGYEYSFNVPLVITVGIVPTFGMHIGSSGNGLLMDFYKNGLTWSLGPQIGLKYNIHRSGGQRFTEWLAEGSASERRNPDRFRDRRLFTYGVEWSYSATFGNIRHHNYTSPTGRVDVRGMSLKFVNNGFALGHVGLNCGRHLNMSVYGGYGSIYTDTRVFPLSLRGTWLFGDSSAMARRWLAYLDGGCLFREGGGDPGAIAKLGGGYRISLSRTTKLDLMVAYQFAYSDLTIYDDYGYEVPESRIRCNNNFLNSINLSIGITL